MKADEVMLDNKPRSIVAPGSNGSTIGRMVMLQEVGPEQLSELDLYEQDDANDSTFGDEAVLAECSILDTILCSPQLPPPGPKASSSYDDDSNNNRSSTEM